MWKLLFKDGVLYMICLIYTNTIWGLDDAYIEIEELRIFLGGHREVFYYIYKEVFADVDSGEGTQEVICGSSSYQNVLGGGCIKGVEIMVYDILDEDYLGEDQVEYFIPLSDRSLISLFPTTYLYGIANIEGGSMQMVGKRNLN